MAVTNMTVAMIGNPVADKGHGGEVGDKVFELLSEAGLQHGFTVIDLTGNSYDDSLANARNHADLYDALVVVGGDGMIALGVNAVRERDIPLGIVAVGSGNDFARGLDLPVNRVETAVNGIVGALVNDTSITVDMGHLTVPRETSTASTDSYFAGMLSCGVDASINDRANHSHLPNGTLRYLAAVLVEITRLKPFGYHITATLADGRVDERDIVSPLLTVANSRHIGGGIEVSPYSVFDDGLLDLVWIDHMPSLRELATVIPNIYNGKLLSSDLFRWERVRDVEITRSDSGAEPPTLMADGEYIGNLPVRVSAVKRALRVLVPPAVARDQITVLRDQALAALARDGRDEVAERHVPQL